MRDNFVKYILKCLVMITAVWITVCRARPADGNYDTIMAGDQAPAESIKFQNFDTFYNAGLEEDSAMSELQMEESRGNTYIRPPQALSDREKRLQESDDAGYDVQREKRNQKGLQKGTTQAKHDGLEWEQFDYDSYVHQG